MINLIIGLALGCIVTYIVIRNTKEPEKTRQIDPRIIVRAQQKANQSSRTQIVVVYKDYYTIGDAVRGWHKSTDNALLLCEVFPDKSCLLPSEA
jgi:hypothetical protein